MRGDDPERSQVRGPTFAAATRQLHAAALARAVAEPDAADRIVPLLTGSLALRPHTVDRAIDAALHAAAHDLLACGWRPAEIDAFAAKRLDPLALGFLRDALAGTAAGAPPWLPELREVAGGAWWSSAHAHVAQWSARHECNRAVTLRVVVDVLALLAYLPRTDEPLPGMPPRPAVAGDLLVDDEKLAHRIDALLARSVASDHDAEAAACAAKAEQLLLRHASTPVVRHRVLADPRRIAAAVGHEVAGLLHRAVRVFSRPHPARPAPAALLPPRAVHRPAAEEAAAVHVPNGRSW